MMLMLPLFWDFVFVLDFDIVKNKTQREPELVISTLEDARTTTTHELLDKDFRLLSVERRSRSFVTSKSRNPLCTYFDVVAPELLGLALSCGENNFCLIQFKHNSLCFGVGHIVHR